MLQPCTNTQNSFGENLTAYRKEKAWSQEELSKNSGITRRMITYYESQGGEPPAHVIVKLAKSLNVTTDGLLGLNIREVCSPKDIRLWKKLLKVQELSDKDRKIITETIDALTARSKAS